MTGIHFRREVSLRPRMLLDCDGDAAIARDRALVWGRLVGFGFGLSMRLELGFSLSMGVWLGLGRVFLVRLGVRDTVNGYDSGQLV